MVNSSLKTISLKDSTSSGQLGSGQLYESGNQYLNILQSQDNTNIIFDFNNTKLSSIYQPLLSSTNKLSSDFITGLNSLSNNLVNGGTANGAALIYNNTIKKCKCLWRNNNR
jgi:hypothetical protein